MQGDEINFRFRCRLPLGGLPPSTSCCAVGSGGDDDVPLFILSRRPQYARLEQFPFNFSNLNRATQSNSDFLANYYIIRIAADFCFTTEEAYGGKTDSLLIVWRI